jgi:dCMP deaminase
VTRARRGEAPAGGSSAVGPPPRAHRVDWHTYFMNIARQVATRSTCDRKHVGAVIVRDRTILSTGYNGSIRGMPHCDDVGHDIDHGHCVATIHAEANAILQAAKNGSMIDGAELYTTASPCWNCFKLIVNAGIRRIYYGEFYRDAKSLAIARQLGIDLVDLASVLPEKPPAGCDWDAPAEPPASGSRGGSLGGRGGRGVRRRA